MYIESIEEIHSASAGTVKSCSTQTSSCAVCSINVQPGSNNESQERKPTNQNPNTTKTWEKKDKKPSHVTYTANKSQARANK